MASNIYEAAATGDIAYLKQHSSKLREKNERGWTVLHFAARYGQLETTQYLCQQPIDHNALNGEGKSAYQLAQFWGNEKVAEVLRSYEPSTEKPSKKSTVMNQPLNHFAGNPLNRCSWYRDDPAVLMKLARSPQAKYIILQKQNMLYNESTSKLYYATYSEVAPIVDELYGDTEQSAQQQVILVFLGIDEAEDKEAAYWALDVTPKGIHTDKYHAIINDLTSKLGVKFENPRPKAFTLDKQTAGILAQALSMVDWNARNTFCPACGQETISEEGGHKRYCPPRSENDTKHERCISTKGVSNFSYPRTDPVVIVCIVHPNEDKILLGRQNKWPGKMYSCIAGFVEAGESVEEAVRREAFEETGIIVDQVNYHSSQPWPFPNSLMLGFIARAKTVEVNLKDKELESAIWFFAC